MNDGLDRKNVISVIPDANDPFIQLRITDYVYDDDSDEIIIAAIYQDQSVTLKLCDKVLSLNDYPDSFGKRYFQIDGHVFFISDAHDIAGVFDRGELNEIKD